MKKNKISVIIGLIFTILLLSACEQQTTPGIDSQKQEATSPISSQTPPTASTLITTAIVALPPDMTALPTPTKSYTTIAIANVTSVPYATRVPTLNITPIVLPTPTSDTQVILTPGNGSPSEPDAEERNFLELLNSFRKSKNSPPLTFEPHLFQSARWLAQDMATKSYINHTDSLGRNVAARLQAFGYGSKWVGENIAGGLETAAENLSIWQSDDIHLNNMANPFWTKVGIGRYYFKTGYNRWVWVLDMG